MRMRWILGPMLALALGLAGLVVGLQAPARTALGAQSDAATGTPASGRGGGKSGKGAGAKANAVQDFVAALHTGDCRNPAEPAAFTLASLAPQINDAGTPAAQGASPQGKLTTSPLATGNGSIAASFDSLFDPQTPYVLVVHGGKDATGPAVACGEVAGVVANGQLALALRPVGNNDVAGLAVLAPTNNGGTAGSVFVFSDLQAGAKAAKTPGANGAGKGAAKGTGGGRGGGKASGRGAGSGGAAAGGGGRAARGQGGGGGGRGGQGAGPSGGVGPAVTGGIGTGQQAATRVPRSQRTPTGAAQTVGTPPAATTAPAATVAPEATTAPVATETTGLTPAATGTTNLENPVSATVSAIETATIATVAPPTAVATTVVEPTAAVSNLIEPTVATSDVVAPTEAAPADVAPAEAAPATSGTPGA